MTTPAPGPQASTSELRAAYQRAQAEAEAARTEKDISTPEGDRAMELAVAAEAAYAELNEAWVRERYTQAELDEIEAQAQAEGGELELTSAEWEAKDRADARARAEADRPEPEREAEADV